MGVPRAPEWVVAGLLLGVAFGYSSVGLGGGSTYTALLALAGLQFGVIPTISLTLNLLVSTIGSFNFLRHGHGRLRLIAPFVVASVPMSYVGGVLHPPPELFGWLLLASLVLVALRIYVWSPRGPRLAVAGRGANIGVALALGALLGFVAGVVGIGGGIYLVPMIIFLGLGGEKEAAAAGAVFVWANSAAGLAARVQHHPAVPTMVLPLAAAVLIGGALGSQVGATRFAPRTMQRVLGAIVVVAILSLGRRLLGGL